MMQFNVTPASGKRLIAKAVAGHPAVQSAWQEGTLVVVAGTTNGYVAEEILTLIGQSGGFQRRRFFRGVTLPAYIKTDETGRLADESRFPGDVVISKGKWEKGLTLFDVVDKLKEGDVILKGANAVDLARKQAGILIGHPKGGTTIAALQAVAGRRVRLILPVGLEKRVSSGLNELAAVLNRPGARGARLLPVPGEILTEIEALAMLTGVKADLVAAGGVGGAEGAVWLAISGSPDQEKAAMALIQSVAHEPSFTLGEEQ
jgi:hypothetical protein